MSFIKVQKSVQGHMISDYNNQEVVLREMEDGNHPLMQLIVGRDSAVFYHGQFVEFVNALVEAKDLMIELEEESE